jgi:hypothetical protein
VTDPPRGRDGSPSVAALAVQVSGLRRDVEALTARVDVLTRTQEEHAVVLEGITELRGQVEKILALVSEDDQASSSGWFWLTMDEHAREEKFSELFDWVEAVLRAQYPDYVAEQIKPCWSNHPEAKWELAWLYQLWSVAFLAKHPDAKAAADWHDRWCPGVLRRLGAAMSRCKGTCYRDTSQTYPPMIANLCIRYCTFAQVLPSSPL